MTIVHSMASQEMLTSTGFLRISSACTAMETAIPGIKNRWFRLRKQPFRYAYCIVLICCSSRLSFLFCIRISMSFCILMKYSSETPNNFASRREVSIVIFRLSCRISWILETGTWMDCAMLYALKFIGSINSSQRISPMLGGSIKFNSITSPF